MIHLSYYIFNLSFLIKVAGMTKVKKTKQIIEHYLNYRALSFSRDGRVLYIKIDWVERHNAVGKYLHTELARVFYDVANDDLCDVVVLTGSGRWFCAGGDMDWFQNLIDDKSMWLKMIIEAKNIISSMLELEKPIISMINGPAAGLGASIALLCDIVYISDKAKIGDPHVKMGLVAGDGGCIIWPHLVGMNRAKEMLLTGQMLSATEAHNIGLVNHVVSHDLLEQRVREAANELANGATLAIRWTKTILNLELRRIHTAITDAALAYETLTNASEDHQEAVNAFIGKRQAKFAGK